MGVWIETSSPGCCPGLLPSHPSWVCGLKQTANATISLQAVSHPSWVCGLKHGVVYSAVAYLWSHPSWVCGLKLRGRREPRGRKRSHPSWVCGLKQRLLVSCFLPCNVTPFVGVWIETSAPRIPHRAHKVTPFVGVWIETRRQ